jgi:hypothetical protein
MRVSQSIYLLLLSLALALAGCTSASDERRPRPQGPDGGAVRDNQPGGAVTPRPGGDLAAPTWTAVHRVLNGSCRPCHAAGRNSAGALDLSDSDIAYNALVGQPARCGQGLRVAPGAPADSVLWTKVAPDVATCFGKMPPPPRAGLSANDVALIADWILAGAARQ